MGLRGKIDLIDELIKDKELFHRESFGKDSVFVVAKNDFTPKRLQNANISGVEIVPIAIDDICVYLTAKSQGGIDDVFNRN